MKFSVSLPEKI